MKFVPKRDLWLSCVIWLSVIVLIVAGISPLIVEGAGVAGGLAILVGCFAIAAFLVWLWVGTYYVMRESELFIRSGPIVLTIPYRQITRVSPIRSWLSSTATSIDRLEIKYGQYGFVHISPLDREGFIEEMKRRCPHARIGAEDASNRLPPS